MPEKRPDNPGQFLELSQATDYHGLEFLSGPDIDFLPVSLAFTLFQTCSAGFIAEDKMAGNKPPTAH